MPAIPYHITHTLEVLPWRVATFISCYPARVRADYGAGLTLSGTAALDPLAKVEVDFAGLSGANPDQHGHGQFALHFELMVRFR